MLNPRLKSLLNTEMLELKHLNLKKKKLSSNIDTFLWNIRLGYIGLHRIQRFVKDGSLSKLSVDTHPLCEYFLEGKMTKRSFSTKGQRATQPLALV